MRMLVARRERYREMTRTAENAGAGAPEVYLDSRPTRALSEDGKSS